MGNRLSREQIEQMFSVYQLRQSVREVATKCAVSHVTVERYRTKEQWDERVAEIRARAQLLSDTSLASARADSLKLVRQFKAKVTEALGRKTVGPDDVTVGDMDRLVKLELLLLGGADSRAEVVESPAARWTEQQEEEFLRNGTVPGQ